MLRSLLIRLAARFPVSCATLATLLDRVGGRWAGEDPTFWRRGVMYALVGGAAGRRRLPEICRGPDLETLQGPLVLASIHVGLVHPLVAPMTRLRGDVLVIAQPGPPGVLPYEVAFLTEDAWSRVAATHRALATLRNGGFVLVLVDGPLRGSEVEVALCGRRQVWSKGTFDLARLARAPVIPLFAEWHGRKIDIILGEAVSPDSPPVMAASLARSFERHLVRGEDGSLKTSGPWP